jgi:hypothetical protein
LTKTIQTKQLTKAVRSTKRWLLSLSPQSEEEQAYVDFGCSLTECATSRLPLPHAFPISNSTVLPDPCNLISMGRDALIELSRTYTGGTTRKNDCDLAVEQLALSFARSDDLQVVAAMLRLASSLGANSNVTSDAWRYLLAQQQEDGSFGLLSAELILLKQQDRYMLVRLAVTVEVLWALAAYLSIER